MLNKVSFNNWFNQNYEINDNNKIKVKGKNRYLSESDVYTFYNKVISDNVLYFDWLSQDKLAEYIDMADLCLAGHFNKNINKAKRTIPGKAYIYEAMNKPMILGDNSATHELYNEGNKNIYFVEKEIESYFSNGCFYYLSDKDSEHEPQIGWRPGWEEKYKNNG